MEASAQPRTRMPQSETGGSDLGAIWRLTKSAVKRIGAHQDTDWAAALTYYSILSLFPGLIALVSVVGLLGDSGTATLLSSIQEMTPGPGRDMLVSIVEQVAASGGAATIAFVLGLVFALYAASNYIGGFMRASNAIWEVDEDRPFYKAIPIRFAITLTLVVLIMVIIAGVVLTGPVAQHALKLVGAEGSGTLLYDILKWPALLLLASMALSVLYYFSPDTDTGRFRWASAGSIVGVVVWVIASIGFAFYVANFGSYNKTYGSLAGVIIFMVWLWITNLAVLLGVEINAEIKRYKDSHGGNSPFHGLLKRL